MQHENQRLLAALRRSDFASFARGAFQVVVPGEELVWNWHLDALCYKLEQVRRGEIRRLIVEVPPRSLKSFLVSVAYPAFLLGRQPTLKMVTASYSIDLATKHMNDFRALVRHPWYQALFPGVISDGKDTETTFTTSRNGTRYATSTGGTLTGKGGSFVILDDPLKADDALSEAKRRAVQEWYRNTLFSRLDNKRDGVIILVMQRLHIDDLAGHLRAQPGWDILSLPAIAPSDARIQVGLDRWHIRKHGDVLQPAREPLHVLDDIKSNVGSYNFSAQYQQEPVPIEGELVKWNWFRTFTALPPGDRRIIQSWDVAVKGEQVHDFSVCTTWAIVGRDYYLLDVYRARLLFPELYRTAIDLSRRWRADTIVIEDKQSGSALIQQLAERTLPGVPKPIAFQPKLDKISRMSAESATIEQGHVFVQADAKWIDELRAELAQFPNGRFDDQVDSISQFLLWARTHRSPSIGFARMF